jgi:hypothetical protein
MQFFWCYFCVLKSTLYNECRKICLAFHALTFTAYKEL